MFENACCYFLHLQFAITNRCPAYTVWAAASHGGGQQLGTGQTWNIDVSPSTAGAVYGPEPDATCDASGRGSCQTVDCGGVLACQGYSSPPNTLAEYALNQLNNIWTFSIFPWWMGLMFLRTFVLLRAGAIEGLDVPLI